jgi:SSS family solute:Na+ symporter
MTAFAMAAWSDAARVESERLSIRVQNTRKGRTLLQSFIGLSYELAQLTEPAFFSAQHKDLVALFRRLSPSGILRIGGNTSEFSWFQASPETTAPRLHIPPGDLAQNWMPHRLFAIQPAAIDALAGFLDATGWTAIYGLNFGNSTPERAASEAAYVQQKLGPRLAFFQIGNEPDFYQDANNGTRPPGWGFDDYVREWIAFASAVSERVPEARFGGPDTGASSDWVTRFCEEVAPKLGKHLVGISGHYYAEGPPNDPKVTSERLLAGDPKVIQSTREIVRVADAHGLVYHMSEGNSCFRGGKPGMSDAFAASLWAADYLLRLASMGCGGINLHGGDSRFLSAGLGDHNPGLDAAGNRKQSAPNGFYTPIATEEGHVAEARPVYYGMLLAQEFAGATMLALEPQSFGLLGAYAAEKNGKMMIALVNKAAYGDRDLTVAAERPFRSASLWRLTAPALVATNGIEFGRAAVNADGTWSPRSGSARGDVLPRNLAQRQVLIPAILSLYFVATIVIGWFARARNRRSCGFLNATHSLPLTVVAVAYLAANCGALEVVGLSAMAAQYGVQAFHFYWIGAIPAMIFLALWMMPVYRRSNITSVPQYLEKRFGPELRLLNACVVAITLLLLAGISLYAMAQMLEVFMRLGFGECIVLSASVVLVYILLGGIRATIYNEVFQLAVMLVGLTPLAFRSWQLLHTGMASAGGQSPHLWIELPAVSIHSPMDQLGVMVGLGFILSFGYWCTDFVLMQRAFAAKTEFEARQVPLWAGFGKLGFSLIVVLPGLAADRLLPVLSRTQQFDQALPKLMNGLYGPGMLGVGVTAIVASLMSGLAANVSAFASIATNDIYRMSIRQGASDRHYLQFGRWTIVAAIVFWAIFLLGMTTRRADLRGAKSGFLSGIAVAILHLIASTRGWLRYGSNMNANFHGAIYAFSVALAVSWLSSGRSAAIQPCERVREPQISITFPTPPLLWILSIMLATVCLALNIYWR